MFTDSQTPWTRQDILRVMMQRLGFPDGIPEGYMPVLGWIHRGEYLYPRPVDEHAMSVSEASDALRTRGTSATLSIVTPQCHIVQRNGNVSEPHADDDLLQAAAEALGVPIETLSVLCHHHEEGREFVDAVMVIARIQDMEPLFIRHASAAIPYLLWECQEYDDWLVLHSQRGIYPRDNRISDGRFEEVGAPYTSHHSRDWSKTYIWPEGWYRRGITYQVTGTDVSLMDTGSRRRPGARASKQHLLDWILQLNPSTPEETRALRELYTHIHYAKKGAFDTKLVWRCMRRLGYPAGIPVSDLLHNRLISQRLNLASGESRLNEPDLDPLRYMIAGK